ncbi:MAG TPA: HAD family acid phosphatase [bacterium]|nr:HAD family acid phosphatase [bacterium]
MRKKLMFRGIFTAITLLILLVSCAKKEQLLIAQTQQKILRVGFDVDDTLLFSTPAFNKAREKYAFGADGFWSYLNSLDAEYSIVKKSVEKILLEHKKNGTEIYVITARPADNGEKLKEFLSGYFGIPKSNIYFEPTSKIEKIKELKLDIFYGDSDTDIKDAMAAGVKGVRILRSEQSSYRDEKTGKLKNYNPGIYNEEIIPNSED